MKDKIKIELNKIAQALYDKKGFNILCLDVRGISSLADYVIIAEGNIDRHIKALSTSVRDVLRDMGLKPLFVEGESTGDWIVIDFSEVVIHLFVSDLREKYALEELWSKAKIVDLEIVTDPLKKALS
jgi:ribosome-associated protein